MTKLVELSFVARNLSQSQCSPRVRQMLGHLHAGHAEMFSDLLQVFAHRLHAFGTEEFRDADASFGRFRMQLETAPVERDVVFIEQSDQTTSLSDVAERSDEVGVEEQGFGHCCFLRGHCVMSS